MAPHGDRRRTSLVADLQTVLAGEPIDVARAALVIARVEFPDLEPEPCLTALDRLGGQAAGRLAAAGPSIRDRIAALNQLLFVDLGFAGNRASYDDFRNSFLNLVIERRLGIPITLALVYMEVARRAGLEVRGVAFPGHFLMRVPARGPGSAQHDEHDVILDPFAGGVELTRLDCRNLLVRHVGPIDAHQPLDPHLLAPCPPTLMVSRMLNNLKRAYVDLRSFPQARAVSDLLLAVDPLLRSELRDRGLLAYHLDDFPAALRDLEDYLRLNAWSDVAGDDERDRIREHVKALRRRVAGMN